ncbi:MAG: MliC family protein [Paraglaciecola sp.]
MKPHIKAHLPKSLLISFVTVSMQACSPQASIEDKKRQEAEDAKQYTQVIFECERNDPVTVRFYQDSERAVMTRNNEDIELTQQPTASGFSYSNGPNSIRGKGDDLTVHIGRMAAIHCRAM